jgi:hypothetical protein
MRWGWQSGQRTREGRKEGRVQGQAVVDRGAVRGKEGHIAATLRCLNALRCTAMRCDALYEVLSLQRQ